MSTVIKHSNQQLGFHCLMQTRKMVVCRFVQYFHSIADFNFQTRSGMYVIQIHSNVRSDLGRLYARMGVNIWYVTRTTILDIMCYLEIITFERLVWQTMWSFVAFILVFLLEKRVFHWLWYHTSLFPYDIYSIAIGGVKVLDSVLFFSETLHDISKVLSLGLHCR